MSPHFLRAQRTPSSRFTQYEIPFKLSISTFHVSVMAITPAIASHKVRHPSWSPSNFSAFIASDFKKLAAVTFALRVRGWGGAKATEPTAKRRPLSVVPDAQCQGGISKSLRLFHTKLPQIERTLLGC
jgi:hypothetical protein